MNVLNWITTLLRLVSFLFLNLFEDGGAVGGGLLSAKIKRPKFTAILVPVQPANFI